MRSSWRFSPILFRAGGLVVFAVTLGVLLLFAEGYQYDVTTKDFVKKGLIYFEKGLDKDAKIFVDEKEFTPLLPNEIRLPTGVHNVEIKKQGALSWSKQVIVPEQSVVRFPKLLFIPERQSYKELFSLKDWKFAGKRGNKLIMRNEDIHSIRVFDLNDEALSIYEAPFEVRSGFYTISLSSSDEIFAVRPDGRVVVYDPAVNSTLVTGEFAQQLVLNADGVFLLSNGGSIDVATHDFALRKPFLQLPDSIAEIIDYQENSGVYGFLLRTKSTTSPSVVVATNKDGAILFTNKANSFTLEKELLTYTLNDKIATYNLQEKEEIQLRTLPRKSLAIAGLQSTFNILFVSQRRELLMCDRDGENCATLIKLEEPFLFTSPGQSFAYFGADEKFIRLQLGESEQS